MKTDYAELSTQIDEKSSVEVETKSTSLFKLVIFGLFIVIIFIQ